MKCTTIDEVVTALTIIIEECKKKQSTLGYFAVLYRKVTLRVKQGIINNVFENGSRMEQLDVDFANRYLDAYDAYQQNKSCSESWEMAFDSSRENGHIILQHLLLGINAHINLDLGIAALDAVGDQPLESIQNDFNSINKILSELVEDVKSEMGNVSPIFKWLIPLAPKTEEMMINFSIQLARDGAWKFSNELNTTNDRNEMIQDRDVVISLLGNAIRKPGILLHFINRLIGLAEWRSVAENLKIMET